MTKLPMGVNARAVAVALGRRRGVGPPPRNIEVADFVFDRKPDQVRIIQHAFAVVPCVHTTCTIPWPMRRMMPVLGMRW